MSTINKVDHAGKFVFCDSRGNLFALNIEDKTIYKLSTPLEAEGNQFVCTYNNSNIGEVVLVNTDKIIFLSDMVDSINFEYGSPSFLIPSPSPVVVYEHEFGYNLLINEAGIVRYLDVDKNKISEVAKLNNFIAFNKWEDKGSIFFSGMEPRQRSVEGKKFTFNYGSPVIYKCNISGDKITYEKTIISIPRLKTGTFLSRNWDYEGILDSFLHEGNRVLVLGCSDKRPSTYDGVSEYPSWSSFDGTALVEYKNQKFTSKMFLKNILYMNSLKLDSRNILFYLNIENGRQVSGLKYFDYESAKFKLEDVVISGLDKSSILIRFTPMKLGGLGLFAVVSTLKEGAKFESYLIEAETLAKWNVNYRLYSE